MKTYTIKADRTGYRVVRKLEDHEVIGLNANVIKYVDMGWTNIATVATLNEARQIKEELETMSRRQEELTQERLAALFILGGVVIFSIAAYVIVSLAL